MERRKSGLTLKFIAFISGLIILTSLSLSWFFIRSQVFQVKRAMVNRGEALARNLAYVSEYEILIAIANPVFAQDLLLKSVGGVLREDDVIYGLIMDSDGEVLAALGTIEPEEIFKKTKSDSQKDIKTKDPVARFYNSEKGEPICDIAAPIITQTEEESEYNDLFDTGEESTEEEIGEVRVGLSLVSMNAEIARLKRISLFLTLIVIIVGILMTIFLVSIIITPIKQLVLGTEKIAQGDLNYKVSEKFKDEIGDLAHSFNQMTAELKRSRNEIENYNLTLEAKVKERTNELMNTQAQLIQSAKLAAVGQLGAGVAHELNNPLGGILGYAQFILKKLDRPEFGIKDLRDCSKYITYIERESTRCKDIVVNLLKFSRKSVTTNPEPVELGKAIEEILAFLKHQLDSDSINVITRFNSDLAKTFGVGNRLQQVFTNLIMNAQQAMLDGGALTITAENILDETSQKVKGVKLEFTDTGEGIPEENLLHIFEPFFTTKLAHKGTGLGLSISYQIIQDHKGSIVVKSQEGKGSTFTITLPASEE